MILNPEICLVCSPEAVASVHRRELTASGLELQQRPPNSLDVPLSGQILAHQKARYRHLNSGCVSTTTAGVAPASSDGRGSGHRSAGLSGRMVEDSLA